MNRVKKTERLYIDAKPEIDRVRAIEAGNRRMRRAARRTAEANRALKDASWVHTLETSTVKVLKGFAKARGVKGYSKMTKPQLVAALQ